MKKKFLEPTQSLEVSVLSKIGKAVGLLPLEVKFKKLDERAVIPTYAHEGDVGMDLTAIDIEYDIEKDLYIYHTGLAFESDLHYGQLLFPRSLNRKTDAYLCNSVGIADSAIYRGEILACFKNRESINTIAETEANNAMIRFYTENFGYFKTFSDMFANGLKIYNETKKSVLEAAKMLKYAPYKVGDKIIQMVFVSYPNVKLIETEELSDSSRGTNGFGSSGN